MTRRVRKGARVLEYKGELISHAEADTRYDDFSMKRHHTFLFAVDRWHCLDGAPERGGGDASFINHSCEPNCEAHVYGKKIFISALRTIEAGEELFYDYRYDRQGGETPDTEKFYACRCGTPSCRGTILKPKRKPRRTTAKKKTKKTARRGQA